MTDPFNRRSFLKTSLGLAAGFSVTNLACGPTDQTEPTEGAAEEPAATAEPLFKISLAQWSLNPLFFTPTRPELDDAAWNDLFANNYAEAVNGELDPLDFPLKARELGFDAVEYVNQFYFDKAGNESFGRELKARADGEGITNLLIMVDREGALGDPDEAARIQAVENHHRWVEAAQFLGCHSIRVNAESSGSYEEQQQRAADGLRRLCEFADPYGINVIVENHGGLSSNGQWLAGVMTMVDHPRVGTLPDFGNFQISPDEEYDRYLGVEELMPFAKSVSAKSHDFDAEGNEIHTDYMRMMQIVLDAGYRGYVGVEYEGDQLSPVEGIQATKALLERVRQELAGQYA